MPKQSAPPSFTGPQLESLCKGIASTTDGLTGTEIGHVLTQIGVPDPFPTDTKWRRLYNALARQQNCDGNGHKVLDFIHHSLAPARYAGRGHVLDARRSAINVPLAFYGLQFHPDGKFRPCKPASTLPEAEQRADRLKATLEARNVDLRVLAFCRSELVQDNYFHAVLEASKSVASLMREMTGLTTDGAELAQQALGGKDPHLRINSLATDTHRSEQSGFCNLLVGLFGTFRNPGAHAPKIEWPLSEEDALDLMSLASYAHRRLRCAVIRTPSTGA